MKILRTIAPLAFWFLAQSLSTMEQASTQEYRDSGSQLLVSTQQFSREHSIDVQDNEKNKYIYKFHKILLSQGLYTLFWDCLF